MIKKNNLLKISSFLSLIFIMTTMFSCGDDDSSNGDNSTNTISISASASSVNLGESISFTVSQNNNTNVTSDASITVNGSAITGSTYTASTAGTYTASATYNNLTTSNVSFTVVDNNQNSVVLTVDENSKMVNTPFTFTVTQNGNDVTAEASISVDGNAITGNIYTPIVANDHTVTATLDGESSNQLDVSSWYTNEVLIEDFTGLWCGWCPRVVYAIESLDQYTTNYNVAAIHVGDVFDYGMGSSMAASFGVQGYPTAKVNRTDTWSSPETANLAQIVNLADDTADSSLTIESSVSGNQLTVEVDSYFKGSALAPKLVIYIQENGLSGTQDNYTTYYNDVDVLYNFAQDHVFTESITAIQGDALSITDGMATNSYTVTIPSEISNPNNIEILAFILESTGTVSNSRKVSVNGSNTLY